MTDIYLIEATPEYAEQVWQFRQEIFDCDKDSESQFAGCLSLDEAASAEEWIRLCQLRRSETTCKQTGVDVPSTTYFAKIQLDIFFGLGYEEVAAATSAKEMLRLNLSNAKELGIEKILITCHSDNAASEKTIIANGGIYEKMIVVDGIEIKRYWVKVEK